LPELEGEALVKLILAVAIIMNAFAASSAQSAENEYFEINTQLMESTFQIVGPSAKQQGATSGGTVFIMGKLVSDDRAAYVLITAAHVLEEIGGNTAKIFFRWRNDDGSYGQRDHEFAIRENGKALYVKHNDVDVAAMYMKMPIEFQKIKMLPIDLIGSDEWLKKFEVHPGDELVCLGYPLFAAGQHGYPILRSGKIASYPIVPAKEQKNWLFDFRIFPGNSGGPVYFADRNRMYGGATHVGEVIQFLAGIITQQVNSTIFKDKDLSLGVVIPAEFVRETLNLLPERSPYQ
jgi:V8-like Glu-specific endopeptidase